MDQFKSKLLGVSPKLDKIKFEKVIVKLSRSEGVDKKLGIGKSQQDDTKFFSNNWMPFVMATLIGFKKNLKSPLPETAKLKKDTFKFQQIYNGAPQLLNLLLIYAVSVEGYQVLQDSLKLTKCIEEYANGGLDFMLDKITKENMFLNDNDFINFLFEYIGNPMENKEK